MVPAVIIAIAWVRSIGNGTAPKSSNVRACTLLGRTRILCPTRCAGARTSRRRFEICRNPFSNQPSTREIHPLLDLAGKDVAERAVHGGTRGLRPGEQERQGDTRE